jgi:hypothetical protein
MKAMQTPDHATTFYRWLDTYAALMLVAETIIPVRQTSTPQMGLPGSVTGITTFRA